MEEKEIKNRGLTNPYIKPEEWVHLAGSGIPDEILQSNGDWSEFFKDNEAQSNSFFDPCDCTVNGALNQVQAYLLRKFGVKEQFSKRALAIVAGVRPPGADPQQVYEAIRKYGFIPESKFPFDSSITTLEKFLDPSPYTIEQLQTMGQDYFLSKYTFNHEYLFYPTAALDHKIQVLEKKFKGCPPCVSVVAWKQENGEYVKDIGEIDGHWTAGEKDGKTFWGIKDSYDPFDKALARQYDFGFAKIVYITNIPTPRVDEKVGILSKILDALKQVVALLFQQVKNLPPPAPRDFESLPKPVELPEPHISRIIDWANAIKEQEGFFPSSASFRRNNPGNLKFAFQKGATKDPNSGFAVFKSYQDGFNALCLLLERACSGKSKIYSPNDTLRQFTANYAPASDGNNPEKYAEFLANKLKVPITIEIRELL